MNTPRTWRPDVYLTFEAYRARPVADLLARVDLDGVAGDIADLGCGAGNVTLMVAQRFPERRVTGLDSSPSMIADARKRSSAIHWEEGDIAAWRPPQPLALIFSNAALHWLGDHDRLFPRLIDALTPGGQLAAQMPNTADAPYRACLAELLAQDPWRRRLAGVATHPDPLRAADYYALLRPQAALIDLWETHYSHALDSLDAVVTWVTGTALVPYLSVLETAEKTAFLAGYKEVAAKYYPLQADGKVLFTMRRLFVVARRQ